MVKFRSGKIALGQTVKAAGFVVIAIGGGYVSLTKDFRLGFLIIAIGALVIAVGEFL